jgi:hypothetical protein
VGTLSSEKMQRLIHGIALGRDPGLRTHRGKGDLRDLRRAHAAWWNHPNVVGLCFARKLQGGMLRSPALQVLVREKLAKKRVQPRHRIPEEVEGHPVGIKGRVPTDVRAVGEGRLEVLVSADRPIRPGYNVGGERTGSGTLTCAVRSRNGGARLGLSCGHVLARFGSAAPGERVLAPSYENIVANDYPQIPLGTLVAVLPIGFADSDATRNVDAATFLPDSQQELEDALAILGVRPEIVRPDIPLGLPVRKVGYATELTVGVIQALHVLVTLTYPRSGKGVGDALFADQIGVSSFTQEGDSGALVVDDAGSAVGMHFASFEGMSICTPMSKVLGAVGCDLAATGAE